MMRKYLIFISIVLAIFCIAALSIQQASAQPEPNFPVQADAQSLISAVNALRVENGLPAYSVNSILTQIAQDQANYMAATGNVAHRSGLTQRILAAGYPLAGDLSLGGFRAENITGGPNKTAALAVQEWTGDSLHLNTMLSPNLTEIGAGSVKVGDMVYLAIDCARPTTSGIPQAYTPAPGGESQESYSSGEFIIPVLTSAPDENGLVYHEVQSGQSLWAIAIAYGVKIDAIRALNGLGQGTEIYQGDKLLIREDAPPPTTINTSAPVAQMEVPTTQIPTMVVYPTVTFPVPASGTATQVREDSQPSNAGIVVGIAFLALFLAGYLTWIGSRRSN